MHWVHLVSLYRPVRCCLELPYHCNSGISGLVVSATYMHWVHAGHITGFWVSALPPVTGSSGGDRHIYTTSFSTFAVSSFRLLKSEMWRSGRPACCTVSTCSARIGDHAVRRGGFDTQPALRSPPVCDHIQFWCFRRDSQQGAPSTHASR
jgi:hypothetical protein